MEKTKTISSNVRKESRASHTLYSFQNITGILSQHNKAKERKGNQTGKKNIKLSLFIDDMILYLKDSKISTRNVLYLINIYSKVEYKNQHRKVSSFSKSQQ
jgi:hypothetical protein